MFSKYLTIPNTIQRISTSWKQSSFDEKLLISHFPLFFLSVYTCPVAVASAVGILFFSKRLTPALHTVPNIRYLYAWFLFVSLTAIVYGNWLGLGAGILFFCFVLFALYFWVVMTPALFSKLKRMLVGFSYLAFAVALLQKLLGIQRPFALFYNPNYYGYICVLVTIICINRYLVSEKTLRLFPKQILPIAINITGIALSQCRTAWVALFVGTFVLLLIRKKWKALVVCAIGMAIFAVGVLNFPDLLPRMDKLSESLQNRLLIWQTAWQAFLAHPLSGQGFFTYLFYSKDMPNAFTVNGNSIIHAHNIFLDALANFGLIGNFLLLNFMLPFLMNWIRKIKDYPQLSIALACFCAMLIHGITDLPMLGLQSGIITLMLFASSGILNPHPALVGNELRASKKSFSFITDKTLLRKKSARQIYKG